MLDMAGRDGRVHLMALRNHHQRLKSVLQPFVAQNLVHIIVECHMTM